MSQPLSRFFGQTACSAVIAGSLFFSSVPVVDSASITLLVESFPLSYPIAEAETKQEATSTLINVATNNNLTTFVTLVKEADLEGMLTGNDNYTIFAPTNEAFQAQKLEQVRNDKKRLQQLLKYHIVRGQNDSEKLKLVPSLTTLEGSKVKIGVQRRSITVDEAIVRQKDLKANNGVIHSITKVNFPPGFTP